MCTLFSHVCPQLLTQVMRPEHKCFFLLSESYFLLLMENISPHNIFDSFPFSNLSQILHLPTHITLCSFSFCLSRMNNATKLKPKNKKCTLSLHMYQAEFQHDKKNGKQNKWNKNMIEFTVHCSANLGLEPVMKCDCYIQWESIELNWFSSYQQVT